MENKRTRGNFNIMYRLVGLVRPLAPVMVCAVLLGVAGFLCAIFIPVLGVYALLDSLHFSVPVVLKTACILLPILAVARGVLHTRSRAATILLRSSCWRSSGTRSLACCASWPPPSWRAATRAT